MPKVVTVARLGLLYSFFVAVIGLYNAFVWNERAYDVKLQHSNHASKLEDRANGLKAELYFARSTEGRNQALSHGVLAALFLLIARGMGQGSSGGNANQKGLDSPL